MLMQDESFPVYLQVIKSGDELEMGDTLFHHALVVGRLHVFLINMVVSGAQCSARWTPNEEERHVDDKHSHQFISHRFYR